MKPTKAPRTSLLNAIPRRLRWTRSSYYLMSGFVLAIFIIVYAWWPLVIEYWEQFNPDLPFWVQFDWLLLGIFGFMSLTIMAGADLRKDLPIVAIGLVGGLVIESWGTQTELWTYYTFERPPLWIIPAWPIASLSIDRLYRILLQRTGKISLTIFKTMHWILLLLFFVLMMVFVAPTFDKSLTIMAVILVILIIATPPDPRRTILVFLAGSGLGYFLELWGTTRLAWTYYTAESPPLFAVLAHGMAAVAFWRSLLIYRTLHIRLALPLSKVSQSFKSTPPR